MRRISELDALRGLAAFLVMIHHDLFVSRVLDGSFIRQTPLRGLDAGRPFVLLFFVLSGFVLSRSLGSRPIDARSYLTWIVQRAVRLLLPASASVLLAAALYYAFADRAWAARGNAWFSYNWSEVPSLSGLAAQGVLVAQPDLNNVLWSLAVEWRLTFTIPLLVLLARSSRHGGLIVVALTVALAGIVGGSTPTAIYAGHDPATTLRSALYFLLPFAIGVALERSGLCAIAVERPVVLAALLACVGLARVDGDMAIFLWAALVIWTAQIPSTVQRLLRRPILVRLGQVSFSLYLTHVPIMLGAFHALHDRVAPVAIAAISLAVSLAASWVFYVVIERPTHRLARRIRLPITTVEREQLAG